MCRSAPGFSGTDAPSTRALMSMGKYLPRKKSLNSGSFRVHVDDGAGGGGVLDLDPQEDKLILLFQGSQAPVFHRNRLSATCSGSPRPVPGIPR